MCALCGNSDHVASSDGDDASVTSFAATSYIRSGAPKPSKNTDEAVTQLLRGYNPIPAAAPKTITYSYRSSGPGADDGNAYGDLASFQRVTAAQIAATESAFDRWEEVANITFQRVFGANGDAYSNSGSLLLANYTKAKTSSGGFAGSGGIWFNNDQDSGSSNGQIAGKTGFSDVANPQIGSTVYTVLYLHEIGHQAGLAHPSNYDSGSGLPISYANDASYQQDNNRYTVMSYFGANNDGASYGSTSATPMLHDIAAVQHLYGANYTTRNTNTTYGFNSNTGLAAFSLTSASQDKVFAIWDGGGIDTIDMSGYSDVQTIDLRQEQFSSTGGATFNIAVARNAVIENGIGGSGVDTMYGNDTSNRLEGRAGADFLYGFGGNDTLLGGLGADQLDGGTGTDTASYADATGSVQASISGGFGKVATESGVSDTLVSIENLEGSNFDDQLSGDDSANSFWGLNGNDSISGLGGGDVMSGNGGNDTLNGGAGADVMYGDAGIDTATFATETAAIDADLQKEPTAGKVTTSTGTDTLVEIENVIGTDFNDTIAGDAQNNFLTGGKGNDAMSGRDGNDTFDGGDGGDSMNGGNGTDTVTYATSAGGVQADLQTGQGKVTINGGTQLDTYASIENLIGSNFADSLVGDANANVLTAGKGDDYVNGRGGNDTLDGGDGVDTVSFVDETAGMVMTGDASSGKVTIGGATDTFVNFENIQGSNFNDVINGGSGDNRLTGYAGADVIDGGVGADTADYAEKRASVVVALNGATQVTVVVGGVAEDKLSNIENIIGGSAADTLTGDWLANVLNGNGGDDTFRGLGGNDTLDGGAGIDTAVYFERTAAVSVSLNGSTNATVSVGGVAEDTIRNIENVSGGSAGDTLTGDAGDNFLRGLAGADTLKGGLGNDTLDGGTEADAMAGGAGDDTYIVDNAGDTVTELFNQGIDKVRAGGSYTLGANLENLDLLYNGQSWGLGNALDNIITGNIGNNTLRGYGGNDTLNGGAGADTMTGGIGNDTYVVDNAGDAVTELANEGTDTVQTGLSYTLGANVENLTLIYSGKAWGTGNELGNALVGNVSDNVLRGLGGSDTLTGGLGADAFVVNTGLNVSTNVDTITDFSTAQGDVFWLDDAVFKALSLGVLQAADFVAGAAAANAVQNVVYDSGTGSLFYDADGAVGAAQVKFASVTPGTALSASQFMVI